MGKRIPINPFVHQGFNILWFRSLNNWTQADLEKYSGVDQRDISEYEKLSIIPEDKLQNMADAFKVDIKYLRDVPSYPAGFAKTILNNYESQVFNDTSIQHVTQHPFEAMKESYETSAKRVDEAHNKVISLLEKQIATLEAQLKEAVK